MTARRVFVESWPRDLDLSESYMGRIWPNVLQFMRRFGPFAHGLKIVFVSIAIETVTVKGFKAPYVLRKGASYGMRVEVSGQAH